MKDNLIHARTCVYNINYHVVWSVKYRRKILSPEIEEYLKRLVHKIAEEKGVLSRYEALREEADRIKALGKAKLYDALPEKVKEGIARAKEPSKFAKKMRKLLLINPDLTSTAGNYDESGRPAKEE